MGFISSRPVLRIQLIGYIPSAVNEIPSTEVWRQNAVAADERQGVSSLSSFLAHPILCQENTDLHGYFSLTLPPSKFILNR
jgi:hypothetical protein